MSKATCKKCLRSGLPYWIGSGTIAALVTWLFGLNVAIGSLIIATGGTILAPIIAAVAAFLIFFLGTIVDCYRTKQCP